MVIKQLNNNNQIHLRVSILIGQRYPTSTQSMGLLQLSTGVPFYLLIGYLVCIRLFESLETAFNILLRKRGEVKPPPSIAKSLIIQIDYINSCDTIGKTLFRGKFWVMGGSTGDDSYDHTITDKVQAYRQEPE